jgi:hypothetical protein
VNLYIQSFDAQWDVNPMIGEILKHLPITDSMGRADAVVVPVFYKPNYRFSPQLLAIKKKVILMDFTEFCWDAGYKNNVFGTRMTHQFGHLAGEEWAKLDEWVRANPPAVHFKRELFAAGRLPGLYPIEFPCRIPAEPLQSKADFEARPIEVFNCWGLSHPHRQQLHGSIFCNAHDCGINVMDTWPADGRYEKRNWVTILSPHYARVPLEKVMEYNCRSKISVSLPGAGIKCFRSAEAPVDSIMALEEDKLSWSFPWVDGVNCVRLKPDQLFHTLETATRRGDLYEIYRASQETIDQYRSARYAREYVAPIIAKAL